MPIYTKFGDKGNTNLLGGSVVSKDDPKVDSYGSIDELNSVLGIVIAFNDSTPKINKSLLKIQNDLFVIGAELASKNATVNKINPLRVKELEKEIDVLDAELPKLTNFILPGGSKPASLIHHARTVCRRAERRIIALSKKEPINPDIVIYVNRLGDLLFVQARYANFKEKKAEMIWKS